jgi:hypothetical protein
MTRTPLETALRASIPWLLAALLLAIATQIAFATTGLLSRPAFLGPHRSMAPWLTGLAGLATAVALLARDGRVAIGCGAILALLLAEGPLIRAVGLVRSLHAVAALAAFAIALLLLRARLPRRREAAP